MKKEDLIENLKESIVDLVNEKYGEKSKEIEKEISIPPMLFIAFVENAFKHGTPIDDFLTIDIHLKTTAKQLFFTIQNTAIINNSSSENHGIGLENTRKRLESMYPDAYQLTTIHKEHYYQVQLEIQLES